MKQIPLQPRSKLPSHVNWRRRTYTNEEIEAHRASGGNIGLRLEPEDLVIDIDPKHSDAAGRDAADLEVELEMEFGIDLSSYPRVTTGSGGAHIYMRKPAELRTREKLKAIFGGAIEFKARGRQVLAPGCTHPNGNPYEISRKGKITMAPQELLDAIERPAPTVSTGPTEADARHLKECLDQLDVTKFRDYDDWRNVMFACHDASGGAEEARDVFVEWSAGDPEFPDASEDIGYYWDACESTPEGRTLRTLYWLISEGGGDVPTSDPEEDFAEIIAAMTPEQIEEAIYAPQWRTTDSGQIKSSSIHNVVEAMRVLGYDLALDEFSHRIVDRRDGKLLTDNTLEGVARQISETWGTRWTGDPSPAKLQSAAVWLAQQNRWHPVKRYLEALEWDGKPRLETWLIDAAEAPSNEYVRALSKLLLVAAVARVYRPGAKFDTMIILEGIQGTGKSSLVRHLGGQWALEGLPPLRSANDKDVVDAMQGFWLVEVEELSATRKADADTLKAFLSKTEDRVRLAYARNSETFPRQCVFIGTTNESAYLRDMTGNRRMAPIKLGRIDIDAIPRDQLWAEAYAAFHESPRQPLHLPAKLWSTARREQDDRRIHDPWEDALAEYCFEKHVGQGFFPSSLILREAVHIPVADQTQAHTKRLAGVMQVLGVNRRRGRYSPDGASAPRDANPQYGYQMPEEE